MNFCVFESKSIAPQWYKSNGTLIGMNSRECMERLTELADPVEMLNGSLCTGR